MAYLRHRLHGLWLHDHDAASIRPRECGRRRIRQPRGIDGARPGLLPEAYVDLPQLLIQALDLVLPLPRREPCGWSFSMLSHDGRSLQ